MPFANSRQRVGKQYFTGMACFFMFVLLSSISVPSAHKRTENGSGKVQRVGRIFSSPPVSGLPQPDPPQDGLISRIAVELREGAGSPADHLGRTRLSLPSGPFVIFEQFVRLACHREKESEPGRKQTLAPLCFRDIRSRAGRFGVFSLIEEALNGFPEFRGGCVPGEREIQSFFWHSPPPQSSPPFQC